VLDKLDTWLKACDTTHTQCKDPFGLEAALPTRLIDLGILPECVELVSEISSWRETFDRGSCKLIESDADNGEPYLALSYCLGKGLPLTTIRANLKKHMQEGGIPFSEVPRTLQDAFFLVRYLGFRYIWVDCICIVQDDKADWQREAARMGDIYSNAYLTIAATRASHCGQGFLQLRERRDWFPATFSSDRGPFTLYFEHKEDLSPGSMGSLAERFPLKLQRVRNTRARISDRGLNKSRRNHCWTAAGAFRKESLRVVLCILLPRRYYGNVRACSLARTL
jgi:hypothetical protein